MNLLRIGKTIINLDLVRRIDFAVGPDGAPKDAVEFQYADGDSTYVYDGHARAAIPVLKRLVACGETDPPSLPPDRLEELRGVMEALSALGHRPGGGPIREVCGRLAEIVDAIEAGL